LVSYGVVARATGGQIRWRLQKSGCRERHGVVVLGSLFALLAVGIVTLLRMVKLERASDHFKPRHRCRAQFSGTVSIQEQILFEYHPVSWKAGKRGAWRIGAFGRHPHAVLAGGFVGAAYLHEDDRRVGSPIFRHHLGGAAFGVGYFSDFIIDSSGK